MRLRSWQSLLLVGCGASQIGPCSLKPLFHGDCDAVSTEAPCTILRFDFLRQLVKVQRVNGAFFVSNFDIALVLFELDINHLLSDSSSELNAIDVDFNLCLFITPCVLGDGLSLNDWDLRRLSDTLLELSG